MESIDDIEKNIDKADISNSLKKKIHKLINKIRKTGKYKAFHDYISSTEFSIVKNQIDHNISAYCANGHHDKCKGHFITNKKIKCECECHKK
ncbi:MAG: hypothetical protein ACP5UN_03895 [Candidatus Micrarchaeia archaeon]